MHGTTNIKLSGELCWLTRLQNQEASGQKQRLFVCVLSATEWSVSNCTTRALIRTYKFMTTNRSLPPFHLFFSRRPWRPGLRGTQSEKHSSRASLLRCHGFSRTSQKFVPSNIDVPVAKRVNCGTQDLVVDICVVGASGTNIWELMRHPSISLSDGREGRSRLTLSVRFIHFLVEDP